MSESDPADGLIQLPRAPLAAGGGRVVALAICAWFALLLVGTGLVDTCFPLPRPTLEGQEAQADAARRKQAKLLDGSAASLFEYDRRLASRVRRAVIGPYTLFLYRHFGFGREEVVVGRDGWVFLRERTVFDRRDPDQSVERAGVRLEALDRVLAARGTRLFVVPIPRKSALYSELMPLGVDARPDTEARFEAELSGRGIDHVRLFEVYRAFRESGAELDGDPLFFPVGTHWTPRGELIAAEALARAVGLWLPEAERLTQVVPRGKRPSELGCLEYMGLDLPPEQAEATLGTPPIQVHAVERIADGARVRASQPGAGERIALSGTSFSAGRHFASFVSHFTGRPIENVARIGANPLSPVVDLLERSAPGVPELLVLELPGHSAFMNENLALVPDVWSAARITLEPHALTADWRPGAAVGGPPFEPGRRTSLGSLPRGRLAHDGGGLVVLVVRGTVSGAPVSLVVNGGTDRVAVVWRPGQESAQVPLILPSRDSELVQLALERSRGKGSVTVGSVELAALLTRDGARIASARADGPEQVLLGFGETAPLPPHAVLALTFTGRVPKDNPSRPLELAAEVAGDWRELGQFTGLRPVGAASGGAHVFCSLNGLAGSVVTRVRVRGVGPERVGESFIAPLVPGE